MVSNLDLQRVVQEMEGGLGQFHAGVRSLSDDRHGIVPVFHQVLDARSYSVTFEPGSETYQVLSDDQNRFSPPRSLPPILGLCLPDEEDNPSGGYVITRYAYSEKAYGLLSDLLEGGHVFDMNDFLELAWSLAKALDYLHGHDIVHGQWNARSVVAIPTQSRSQHCKATPSYRFEVFNTGVWSAKEVPDYGALDIDGDVHCFAAFLKDLMHRACSTEELPSQATRILEELRREANRLGWKATPDSLRQKELEILDHLYTVKTRSESLIQEGLRPREERCTAARMLELVEDLHAKATSYLSELFELGFQPINKFGVKLQHYTTFSLTVSPLRINSYEGGHVVLTGSGLPDELVTVALDERHEGVCVLSAQPGRIEFTVTPGLPSGRYRISINNRRTNGTLDLYSPQWKSIDPVEMHQPWDGFGNIRVTVRGEQLPTEVPYVLRPVGGEASDAGNDTDVVAVVVERQEVEESAEVELCGGEESLQLTFPCDAPPADYELFANGLPTGLDMSVRGQLPNPQIREGALHPFEIKNHRERILRLTGRDFHPRMIVDFGENTPEGLEMRVESSTEAELTVPSRFVAGKYWLRLNRQATDVTLTVVEPRWQHARPPSLKILRRSEEPAVVYLMGSALPPLGEDGEDGGEYALVTPGGDVIPGAIVRADEVEPGRSHRLFLSPDLSRGSPGFQFGQLETGLAVRIRRQLPRSAWVAMASSTVVALVIAGVFLRQHFAPTIRSVEPTAVYNFGDGEVQVLGSYLAGIELVDDDSVSVAAYPLRADEEHPEAYGFTPRGVRPGSYRLRPVGPLFASAPSEYRIQIRSPGLRVQPAVISRLEDTILRLGSTEDFDVTQIGSLQLLRSGDASLFAELVLQGGRVTLPRGRFRAEDEGLYHIAVDGVPLGELVEETDAPPTVTVVGPRIDAVTPNPVSLNPEGRIHVEIQGANLDSSLWFLLVAEGDAANAPHLLTQTGKRYQGNPPPGSYQLVFGPDEEMLEPAPGLTLRVLPQPLISAVFPRALEPGRKTAVTFTGANLGALDRIVLRPVDAGGLGGVEIPLDEGGVVLLGELEGRYDAELTLASGTYRVEPSGSALTIDVFDDCVGLIDAVERGADPGALLECLETGRPKADLIRRAADLLFDRGLLPAAAGLYKRLGGESQSLLPRFRANFVDSFVIGVPVQVLDLDADLRKTPYGVAAIRLGWGPLGEADFSPEFSLPWDLEYVRALTSSDPETRVAALEQSIQKKTAQAGGFEIAQFGPARDGLAQARLDLAIDLIGRTGIPRARALLENGLLGDAHAWEVLDGASRAKCLFWHGHLLLWYEGNNARAIAELARAARLDAGPASGWSRTYLRALGESEPDTTGDVPQGPSDWEGAFVRVFLLYKEITDGPNYNLLTDRYDADIYLPADERTKSIELKNGLQELEQLPPRDPFAQYAMLHYLSNAQRISWPMQERSDLAAETRARLQGIAVPESLKSLQQFYLVLGDLGPYDLPQVLALARSERRRHADRIEALLKIPMPAAFQELAERLKNRFLGPSVVWWSR